MSSENKMNRLALNQNILGKTMIMGQGFDEGKEETPTITSLGLPVYLNGTHKLPDYGELDKSNALLIGSMTHPSAMPGMPDCSGEIRYEFWMTESEYLIVIRLKLEESAYNETTAAAEILSLVKRNSIPESLPDTADNQIKIIQEMLNPHFKNLFSAYDSMEKLKDWTFNEDALSHLINDFFELVNKS